MASFVNVTARRLHMRKIVLAMQIRATVVALDQATISIDEIPVSQANVNDSRAHIMHVSQLIGDATGAGLASVNPDRQILTFNREDLVLDPDEAFYLNGQDDAGGASLEATCNFWYQD